LSESLKGYAWSDYSGWVSFSCENEDSCGDVYYKVRKENECSLVDIGEECGGGVVAYHDGSGGGLIAATSDQSTGVQWGCLGTAIGTTGTSYGTGFSNTNAIMSGCATRPIAASLARAYDGGGYDDWFLPSKDELNILYTNRVAIGGFDLVDGAYWSSSEEGGGGEAWISWYQLFDGGTQVAIEKDWATLEIRAVRYF